MAPESRYGCSVFFISFLGLHFQTDNNLLATGISRGHTAECIESLFEGVQVVLDGLVNGKEVRHYGVELVFENQVFVWVCCQFDLRLPCGRRPFSRKKL